MPASVKATASIVVNKQVPEFVRDDNQKFIDFLKAYYEWLENFYPQQHLEDIRDIDNTVNMFVEYFSREVLQSIPREVISDKRFLAKHIKDLYSSKGTEDSYKFLFRILYNEDAEVYFPKVVSSLRVASARASEVAASWTNSGRTALPAKRFGMARKGTWMMRFPIWYVLHEVLYRAIVGTANQAHSRVTVPVEAMATSASARVAASLPIWIDMPLG